jgi:hypothetical protein
MNHNIPNRGLDSEKSAGSSDSELTPSQGIYKVYCEDIGFLLCTAFPNIALSTGMIHGYLVIILRDGAETYCL